MQAILVERTGGAEVLEPRELDRPRPGPGQVLVKVGATGVNFIEVYQRTGLYPMKLPFVPGAEFSGVVEEAGEGVALHPGTRVATANGIGAYAGYALAPADRVIVLPDGVTEQQGAAAMLQGMTAHYLATSIRPLEPGMTCLIHAAAGGVGLLLSQIARMRGAHVIGTTSTEEKARLAHEAGANEVILYTRENFTEAVKRMTDGRGVDVVFDSVGKDTFHGSLASLAVRGLMVSYGNSSGPAPAVEPLALSRGGSLYLTRPTLVHYTLTREEFEWRATDIQNWIASGELKLHIHREYPLAEAAQAHRDLEGRQTTGKLLLIP